MATLCGREGIEIAVIVLELWPSGVIVRLAGLPAEYTESLGRAYREDLEAWGQAGREGSPPAQPAERVFGDLRLALSDDLGTPYALRTGNWGGSGRMFRAEWSFEPGPSETASRLTLALIEEGKRLGSLDVEI